MSQLPVSDHVSLLSRIAELEAELEEARDTLNAIRSGDVDAVVINGPNGQQVYTLENADRPYRVLIEQIQEGAVTLAKDGLVLYCNLAFAAMLDTPVERIIGSSLFQFIALEDQPALKKLLVEGGKSEILFKAGEDKSIQTSLSLNELSNEESPILCGVVTDITLQKFRMHELDDKNQQLQKEIIERERTEETLRQAQKMEAVGQLTGGLAHDFNNLLTVILGNLQLISTRISGDQRTLKYINNAIGATERGAGLTQKLLAFSRRQALNSEVLLVNELLPGIQMLAKQVIGVNIDFQILPEENLWHCRTDTNQLESAILNMIINARDAMPNGGRLTLQTANVTIDELAANTFLDAMPGRYVVLTLSDTGSGIPKEVLPHVFEPFFTTKGIGKGSGLGLSMVYGFVRQTNGFITLDSQPEMGTVIRLYLPYAEAPLTYPHKCKREDNPDTYKSATVLVVEDDIEILKMVTDLMEDLGYKVLSASNAHEALCLLEKNKNVDLVFSDVVMPGGMSGLDMARELRNELPNLPVLLTSGYISQSVEDNEQLNEEFRVLRKPYHRQDLAIAMRETLSNRTLIP